MSEASKVATDIAIVAVAVLLAIVVIVVSCAYRSIRFLRKVVGSETGRETSGLLAWNRARAARTS